MAEDTSRESGEDAACGNAEQPDGQTGRRRVANRLADGRAEGDADAELAPALDHRLRHQAIDSDDSEQESQAGHGAEKSRLESLLAECFGADVIERAEGRDR